MKEIITCVGVVFVACACLGDQMSELVEKINKLEKRVVVLEKMCDIKTPEELTAENEKREAEIAKCKLVDSIADKFLKEYFDVEIGDSFASVTNKAIRIELKSPRGLLRRGRNQGGPCDKSPVVIPAVKNFGVFQSAECQFDYGKLTGLTLVAEYDSSYSKDSTDEDFKKQLKKVGDFFGIPSDGGKIDWCYGFSRIINSNSRYGIRGDCEGRNVSEKDGKRRYYVRILDYKKLNDLKKESKKLEEEAQKKRNASGKQYPVSK